MTTTVERSVIIRANPDQINAVALDGARLPEWYEGIQASTPDSTYPLLGGAVNVTYKAAGINFNLTMKSIEYVDGVSFGLEMDGMIKGRTRWELAQRGEGRTKLNCTFEYEMPGGSIGQAVNKMVVEKMNVENLEKSL
ncbi:MAG: SRPBCC family protein, partial [Anaerolineales bacterium]|nr:SRPBCC family protein [Anaerolineales bacterium]